jgi:hypothetical protein
MLDALDLLQAVSGFARSSDPAQSKINKLATIDPAYADDQYPTALPKVTFEGETSMSARTYPVVSPYWPRRGDRVWMVPVGKGWVIGGAVNEASPRLSIRSVSIARSTGLRNCNTVAQDIPGASITLTPKRSGGIWIAVWQADFQSIGTTSTTAIVQCLANGAQAGPQAIWTQSNVATGARVTAIGIATGAMTSPPTDMILKLQSTRGTGADAMIVANASHTALLAAHLE